MSEIWVALCLLSLLIGTINGENCSAKKRVCIIGVGPMGLFSLQLVAENLDELEPIVYDRNSEIGGSWIYTDNGDIDEHGLPVQSGIYESLRTTVPKDLMACPNFSYKGGNQSCVRHETVLEYLRNYTDYYNLHKFIQVNTLVKKVVPLPNSKDWRKTKWLVKTQNLNTNVTDKTICNFVITCNGHKYKPLIPHIPGMEKFPSRVLHSLSYRRPEEFSNQTVLLLGAVVSGQELSFELSSYAKTIYLSHRHKKIITDWSKNVIQVPGVIAAKGRELVLQDNTTIKIDSFIYCTGYKYDFPFLDPSSGLKVHEKYMFPLYKQIVNIEHPSMGFVGLPANVMYFCPKAYADAKYFTQLIKGKIELPSRAEMMKDAEAMLPDNLKNTDHDWQWSFLTGLAKEGGFEPLDDFYKRAQDVWDQHRANNLRHYKEYDLRILDDGNIVVVKSSAI